jgi:PAS domain S-box-containing protein/diguanylate cyclase (GGDEF)-like protein
MTTDGDLNANLQLLVDEARELLGTDTSFLGLRDEQTDEIAMHTLSGIQTEEFAEIRVPLGKGIGGLVAETQEGRTTQDYFSDANIVRADEGVEKIVRKEGLISAVAVPIQIGKNNIGVLYAFNRSRTTFSQADIKTLSVAGNLAALEITRKRLAESQEALLQKEEEFRVISRTTTDAVVLMDEEGKISYWNAAAEKMFGYSGEEVKEKQKAEEKDLHQILAPREFYQAYKKGFAQFQKTGQGPVVGRSLEFTAVKKGGTKFPIEVSISAIKLKDKWRAAGIIRDLSYRKKIETELQRLSYFDVLTGIANRSLYEEILDREWRRAVRQNNWLSMVMCKINHFNEFRNTYGPSESYSFLTKVANALNSNLRRSHDLLVRYDYDLFLIVLPEIEKKAADDLRTKLLESAEKALEDEKREKTNCNFSIDMGAATIKPSQHKTSLGKGKTHIKGAKSMK